MAAASAGLVGEQPADPAAVSPAGFRVASAAALVWVVAAIVVTSRLDGEARWHFEIFAAAGTLVVTTGCVLWAALRARADERRWRLLLAAALASSVVRAVLVIWFVLFADSHMPAALPAPLQLADIVAGLFLLAMVTLVPASPLLTVKESLDPEARSSRWRHSGAAMLDGLMIVSSVMLLRWVVVLKPAIGSRDLSPVDTGFTVARNLCGVLVVTTVLLVAATRRPRDPRVLALTGTGVALLFLGQAANAYLAAPAAQSASPLASACFVAGVLLLGLATLVPARARPGSATRRSAVWYRVLLPYLPLATTLPLAAVQLASHRPASALEIGLGLTIICVVLVRQVVTLAQNAWLLTGLRDSQRLLRHQAHHDELTGLPNRSFLLARLARLTDGEAASAIDRRQCGLLFCDLDDFKLVNDQLGHDVGDVVLQLAAARLRTCVRAEDIVARLGGDEFAILLSPDTDDPMAVGRRVVSAMERPFDIEGRLWSVPASVGITQIHPTDGHESPRTVLRRADAAMYTAKRQGKGGVAVLDHVWPVPGV